MCSLTDIGIGAEHVCWYSDTGSEIVHYNSGVAAVRKPEAELVYLLLGVLGRLQIVVPVSRWAH